MKEVIQVFKIRDNFFFLQRDGPTYKNSCFIFYFILSFSFCFLYFVFDIYIKRFLRSNKTWLSERFPLLSRHELLILEHFLFCFNSFIFSDDYQFWFICLHYYDDYFHYYYLCHCHCYYYCFIFNAKHFSKLAIKTLRLYQFLCCGNVCLIYSSEDFLLKWHYYILLLAIISFIL